MNTEAASVYFAIKSVDEEQRLVYGRATQETLDRQGEVLDYEGSKPYWEEWIKESQDASGGKSMGNVRVMHRPDIAAGKLVRVDFNDKEKSIDVAAKVVDDAEWQKVLEGVYTGFSQGGKYISKKNDPLVTGFGGMPAVRVVIAPKELSLVDRPAVPSATFFEVVKADGSTEQRSFKGDIMDKKIEAPVEEAKKGLWQAKSFLSVLQECNWLLEELKMEREREGDASPIPEELEVCLGALAKLCEGYIGEQLAELKAGGAVAAASEAEGEEEEEGDKSDADSDAEKAAKTGQKSLRAAMCAKLGELTAAHKAYMDTYATGADKSGDEIDAQKAEAVEEAAKAAPAIPSVDEIATAVLAALDKRAADAAKSAPAPAQRPATKLVPVERGSDAEKSEEPFDARKAAFEAPSPVDAFRVMFQNPEAFRIP